VIEGEAGKRGGGNVYRTLLLFFLHRVFFVCSEKVCTCS